MVNKGIKNTLRTIRLYGKLGARFGRKFRLAVNSPAEAVQALSRMLPGFERELMESKDKGMAYAVFVGQRNIGPEELRWPSGDSEIRIAPMISGSKRGGVFQMILGVVLIVVGVLITPYSGPLGGALVNAGIAMVIGGVIQFLTPMPKGRSAEDRPDNAASYSFNGAVNTQAQGNPVPLLYGELIIGSAVISAGISAEDNVYVPRPTDASTGANGSTGGGGSPPWHNDWTIEA